MCRRRCSVLTVLAATFLLFCLARVGPEARAQAVRGTVALNVGEGRLLRLNRAAVDVLVGDSAIADVQVVSPHTLYVYGRKPGQTTLSATDTQSGEAAQMTLRVTRSSAAAQASLRPGDGAVSLEFEGNRMVVRGLVDDLGEALDTSAAARAYSAGGSAPLDRTLMAGTPQVTLRVRIAEVSRTTITQLGLNLNVVADPGSFAFNLVTGSYLGQSVASGLTTSLSGQSNTSIGSTFGQASAGITTHRVNANALLNALQSEGLVTTLAEPNLTTISGQTASFDAGGEVPIPVPQALGVTTIEYKRFGVQLSFTPTVLPGDRIALNVKPEVSELSSANAVSIGGTTVPSFVSRSATTDVEMASGQTLAIAGLFQRNEQNTLSKFPFLGDVPVLGALFRSSSYQRDETELVILVTPFLSQPVDGPSRFLLPTDRATPTPPDQAATAGVGFVVN